MEIKGTRRHLVTLLIALCLLPLHLQSRVAGAWYQFADVAGLDDARNAYQEGLPTRIGGRGILKVIANTIDAIVFINDRPVGKTEELIYLDPGNYEILIKKDGYQDTSDYVSIVSNKETISRVFMNPFPKQLSRIELARITIEGLAYLAIMKNGSGDISGIVFKEPDLSFFVSVGDRLADGIILNIGPEELRVRKTHEHGIPIEDTSIIKIKIFSPQEAQIEPRQIPDVAQGEKRYWVQVAVLLEEKSALRVADRYRAKGYPVVVRKGTSPKFATVYRIRLGGYIEKEKATDLLAALNEAAGKITDFRLVYEY